MTRAEKIAIEIEKGKTEYSPVWIISNEVFTKKASEILNIPIERIQVRRCVMGGENWGKLSVFVFNRSEDQRYYSLSDGEYVYDKLPSNINDFSSALAKKTCV
jgi:hypothetical protein